MSDSIAEQVLNANGIATKGKSFAHYGKLGMKWGVRNPRGKNGLVVSEDHAHVRKLKKKKQSEMSTAELKRVNERLQLERTNRELQSRGALQKIKTGTAIAGTILAVGTTVTTAYNFMNSPAGKAIVSAIKKQYGTS